MFFLAAFIKFNGEHTHTIWGFHGALANQEMAVSSTALQWWVKACGVNLPAFSNCYTVVH